MAKRIGKSKVPLAHQLPIIAENLRNKTGKSVFLDVTAVSYKSTIPYDKTIEKYRLSFVSNNYNDSDLCTAKEFETWPELLDYYFKIMKKEV